MLRWRSDGTSVRVVLAFMLCTRLTSTSSFLYPSRLKRWTHATNRQTSRLVVLPKVLMAHRTLPTETRLLIHWRGEGVEGYSLQFRHVEFRGSLQAVLGPQVKSLPLDCIRFENALNYTGHELTSELKVSGYNQAMQYLIVPVEVSAAACVQAAERCSLIHSLYEIVAEASSEHGYAALSDAALQNEAFRDMWRDLDGPNAAQTWCVRVRHYGSNNDTAKERRYGARARSLTMEREALLALTPILRKLGGKVDLAQPDCKIYVFDGLRRDHTGDTVNVLARRLAKGARTSSINPNTRICVTNKPLCPVAAFIMCNTAQIREHSTVLDPFCGSAATLLATAMLSPSSRTVGIEIAHNGIVNRDDIVKDFTTRDLTAPVALILGDSSQSPVRALAREAINGEPFDCIVTDPPYGIRESTGVLDRRPIDELLQMIAEDRLARTPLLRRGGRLVAFLPHQTEKEELTEILPTSDQVEAAGLQFDLVREQPLNDILSRWLVSYVCV